MVQVPTFTPSDRERRLVKPDPDSHPHPSTENPILAHGGTCITLTLSTLSTVQRYQRPNHQTLTNADSLTYVISFYALHVDTRVVVRPLSGVGDRRAGTPGAIVRLRRVPMIVMQRSSGVVIDPAGRAKGRSLVEGVSARSLRVGGICP